MPHAVIISGIDGAAQFATVFLIFIAVLLITFFTTRFIGSYQKLQGQGRNFEVIESFRVIGNKYLQIIRAGRRYFVISVNKDDISLISEISEEDFDRNTEERVINDRFKQIFEVARDKMTKRGDKQ
ncbi:MAG: flagellar biosynthetic protein FliO [Lachnospiraceae bacterium]|nr:flagellar biosynthetic protein FliO [Lachnospiraceae bacterium]